MCRAGLGIQFKALGATSPNWESVVPSLLLAELVTGELQKNLELLGIAPPRDVIYAEGMEPITTLTTDTEKLYIDSDYDDITELDQMRRREERYHGTTGKYWSSAGVVQKQHPMKTLIDHETGHLLAMRKMTQDDQKSWAKVVRSSLKRGWKAPTKTAYGGYNEMFAESYALKKNGYGKMLTHDMNNFMDDILKR